MKNLNALLVVVLLVAIGVTTYDVLGSGDVGGLKTWGLALGCLGLGFCLFVGKMAKSLTKTIKDEVMEGSVKAKP